MLYRRQWLTCAFQSVISTGINIHVQEPDWSFTLTGPAFLTASSSPWATWQTLKPTTFGVSHINFITEMFLYIHGQVIIRAGVKLLSPGEGPEGEFCKHDGQSMENEPKEQGYENLWSFTQLSSSISIREAAMFVLRVLDNFLLHSHWSIGLRALL